MERRTRMSHDVIISTLTYLEQAADASSHSSLGESNDALLEEIRALREDVTMLRSTNNGTRGHDTNNNPAFQITHTGTTSLRQNTANPFVEPASSPRVSTTDQEDGLRPTRTHPDRARMPARPQSFGSAKRTPPPDFNRATRLTNNGNSSHNKMLTLLDRPSSNSHDQEGLYHLEHPTSEPNDDEHQKDRDEHPLLAFHDTRDNHQRSRSRSLGGRVQPPRIAGSSSNENLNHPG